MDRHVSLFAYNVLIDKRLCFKNITYCRVILVHNCCNGIKVFYRPVKLLWVILPVRPGFTVKGLNSDEASDLYSSSKALSNSSPCMMVVGCC